MTPFQGYVWVIVAGALAGDRWSWWGMAVIAGIAFLSSYLEGFIEAHRAVCPNCETRMPGGCQGEFADEKECMRHVDRREP